jgi:hypothetical protein
MVHHGSIGKMPESCWKQKEIYTGERFGEGFWPLEQNFKEQIALSKVKKK